MDFKEKMYLSLKDMNESYNMAMKFSENFEDYTEEYLKAEIFSIVEEGLIEDGDTLNKLTVDTLCALEIDVPAGVKIRTGSGDYDKGKEKDEEEFEPEEDMGVEDEIIEEDVDEVKDSGDPIPNPYPDKQNIEETLKNASKGISKDTPKVKKGRGKGDHTKPGVISTMIEYVKEAGRPVSKDELLDVLQNKFPERNVEGMKKTMSILHLRAQLKGINISKSATGWTFD